MPSVPRAEARCMPGRCAGGWRGDAAIARAGHGKVTAQRVGTPRCPLLGAPGGSLPLCPGSGARGAGVLRTRLGSAGHGSWLLPGGC